MIFHQNYQKIDGSAYRKIYVVGDLHGCYELLQKKLDAVKFDKTQDLLISVGDLIDRGPQSLNCLRLLREPWFVAVKGNHECMAIDSLIKGSKYTQRAWMYNGGDWVLGLNENEYAEAEELLKCCADLPLVIEVNDNDFKTVVVHADYPHDEYWFNHSISEEQAVWSRERVQSYDETEIQGANLFIFGHTPIKEMAQLGNRIYIDTGAVFYGKLTLLKIK